MTEHERNQTPEPRPDAKDQDSASPSRGMSRRRFGQAALGSVPVLMTLYSNPLRAASNGGGNCHLSGWHSGGSQHLDGGESPDCSAKTPRYWKNNWRRHMGEQEILREFHTVFGLGEVYYFDNGKSKVLTLEDAVQNNGDCRVYRGANGGCLRDSDDRDAVYFGTAALLNSEYNFFRDPPHNGRPTPQEVKEVVKAILDNDDYRTSSGETVSKSELARFLKFITEG